MSTILLIFCKWMCPVYFTMKQPFSFVMVFFCRGPSNGHLFKISMQLAHNGFWEKKLWMNFPRFVWPWWTLCFFFFDQQKQYFSIDLSNNHSCQVQLHLVLGFREQDDVTSGDRFLVKVHMVYSQVSYKCFYTVYL